MLHKNGVADLPSPCRKRVKAPTQSGPTGDGRLNSVSQSSGSKMGMLVFRGPGFGNFSYQNVDAVSVWASRESGYRAIRETNGERPKRSRTYGRKFFTAKFRYLDGDKWTRIPFARNGVLVNRATFNLSARQSGGPSNRHRPPDYRPEERD